MPPSYRKHDLSQHDLHRSPLSINRRRFLQTSAAALSGLALSNCARNLSGSNLGQEASPSASSSPVADRQLHIYTWANYTDDELIKGFKAKTGIDVVVDLFDSNEQMLAKIQAGGGSAYSILYPSDYMVIEMTKQGMLATLDKAKIPALATLKPKWNSPVYDPGNAHNVPFTWGTTGLIYDPETVGTAIKGWDYIWDNRKSLTRKVTLINDVREVMGATLRSLGYSYNTTKPDEIKKAYDRLVQIKPTIANFLTTGWEDQLSGGDVLVSMVYSQDAIALIQEKPNLKYIIPDTGTSVWTDTMVIPKTAPNPEAAYEWINYLTQPEIKQDTLLFPPDSALSKSEGIAPIPEKITELYDQYWTRLTSS
jgi:spermidine/putrescine transport system substrate-binding protein